MKKLILAIVTLSVLFISCDRIHYIDMYIVNKCNESIEVITHRDYVGYEIWQYTIATNSECKINCAEIIFPLTKESIPVFFKRLEIKKSAIEININPLDTNYWNYEIISENNILKKTFYRANAILVVYDEFFE